MHSRKTLLNPAGLGTGLRSLPYQDDTAPINPPLNPGYRPGLFAGGPVCSNALSQIFCGPLNAGGVAIYLYSLSGNPESACHGPANPHLGRTIEPVEVFRGLGLPQANPESSLSREEYGVNNDSTRTFLIFSSSAIPLAAWAYTQQGGVTTGGQVVKRSQIIPGSVMLTIDTSKSVPFTFEP